MAQASANCVVVAARRAGQTTLAACLVLATTRADVNGLARRQLGARKASFAPQDVAVAESGMAYGGITPVGLPSSWPVLVDAVVTLSRAVMQWPPGFELDLNPVAVLPAGLGVRVLDAAYIPGPEQPAVPGHPHPDRTRED